MKTYKQFITELNRFEKFLVKQGIKGIRKVFPKDSLKNIKKSVTRSTQKLRSDPDNPFISPRREAENLVKQFQKTTPGEKGANIMKTKGNKYVNYDPTRVRQGEDISSAAGTFTMRGQSKQWNKGLDKDLKALGDTQGRSILKNTGDQHRAIYNAPAFKANQTDRRIDSVFKKNVLGAPTTENLPKGAVPDAAKKIYAKSRIKSFKRNKPK